MDASKKKKNATSRPKSAESAKPVQKSPAITPAPSPAATKKQAKPSTTAPSASTPQAPTPAAPAKPSPPKAPAAAKPESTAPAPKTAPAPAVRVPTGAKPVSKSAAPAVPPPSILLEGDATPTASASGPGARYILAPSPAPSGGTSAPRELPESYGTGKLLLVARDPHWVYAHWDLTDGQLREANRRSASGTLVLRIRAGSPDAEVIVEQAVHPESRNWFIHVPQAGARYLGELGYYDAARTWTRVSLSTATLTPRDELSEETWVRFETLPFDMPMSQIVALVKQALADNTPLLEALQQLRNEGYPDLPLLVPTPSSIPGIQPPAWTPAQEHALAQVLSMDEVRRVWIGSLEITELLRRQLQRGISSAGLPVSGPGPGEVAGSSGLSSLSSPFGGGAGAPGRAFWFNVNAELIVYGATDPHATVTIGNRPIRLRPDGTFSYRFALPDGDYSLPITATSPDAVEQRQANLAFRRVSEYRGEVPPHPQDPTLQTPSPDHVG